MKYLNFRAKNLDCTKIGGLELVKIGYCIITNLEQQRWSKLMHIFLPGVIPIPQNAKQGNESWGKVTNHHFLASSISFSLPAIWKYPLAQVLILIENLLLLLLKNCLGKDDRMLNMCWPPRNPLLRTVFLESVNFSNPNRAPTESSRTGNFLLLQKSICHETYRALLAYDLYFLSLLTCHTRTTPRFQFLLPQLKRKH